MSEDQIIAFLVEHGFVVQKDRDNPEVDARGWSSPNAGGLPRRLEHPLETARGSLYVAADFIAANGPYRQLEERAPPTDYDRKDLPRPVPFWKGQDLARLLDVIAKLYS